MTDRRISRGKLPLTLVLVLAVVMPALRSSGEPPPPPPPKFEYCKSEAESCKPTAPPKNLADAKKLHGEVTSCISNLAARNGNGRCAEELKVFDAKAKEMFSKQ